MKTCEPDFVDGEFFGERYRDSVDIYERHKDGSRSNVLGALFPVDMDHPVTEREFKAFVYGYKIGISNGYAKGISDGCAKGTQP